MSTITLRATLSSPMQSSFGKQIDKARDGDTAALDALLGSVHDVLEERARAALGERMRARVRASDIVQSAYVRVLRDLPSFRGSCEREFLAWLGGVVENTVRDRHKYFEARKRQKPDQPAEQPGVATPSSVAANREDLCLVTRALRELNEDYRKALVLSCVENRPHKDVAEVLGRTVPATRVLLHRARAALAGHMARLQSGR